MATKKKLIPGRDALQRYLDEISETPLLSDAEEQQLSLRIQQGDRLAADKLAAANLRYVVSIAQQYRQQTTISIDDLVSEGNIGLMKATTKFDASRGKRFATFAAPYIRQAIEDAIKRMTDSGQQTVDSAQRRSPLMSHYRWAVTITSHCSTLLRTRRPQGLTSSWKLLRCRKIW